MTPAQRVALAIAFERLAARIAAQPVTPPHPVIRRKPIVVKARRGSYRRRMIHSEE